MKTHYTLLLVSVRTLTTFIILVLLSGFSTLLSAEDLEVRPGEAYIELAENAGGFDLYIKAKEGLGSVLITESTADPNKRADSFAFRSWDYNPVNGDEKRLLNGEFIRTDSPLYFLIDSSPEPNEFLESAYRIYIPYQLTYGYSWSREGQVQVHRGTWLNIRTFEKPYADYNGEWRDNPFILSMKVIPPPPESKEMDLNPVNNVEEAVERIANIIRRVDGNVDVVLAVDTTVSMKNDIGFIQEALVPLVRKAVSDSENLRVGLVLYRDYKEAYLTRTQDFTDDLDILQQRLNKVTVSGGRDIEEAVNEGLYSALTEFRWEAPERLVIQVGDALAHSEPRGEITLEMVENEARKLGVSIYPIRLPEEN